VLLALFMNHDNNIIQERNWNNTLTQEYLIVTAPVTLDRTLDKAEIQK
jgi:hypothetical protein